MKHSFTLVLIFTLLFLVACKDFGFGNKDKTPKTTTFVGGTKGLEVAFSPDQPPLSILDQNQEDFFITLLLQNKGEYTLKPGELIASLSGVVQKDFSITAFHKKNAFEIFGTSKETDLVIPGAEEQLEFGSASYKPDLPGDTTFTLRADVCYTYQTRAVAKVCLKKNVVKKDFADVCKVTDPAVSHENSGGPIQISDVRQSTVGTNKVKITFKVSNKDVGAVFAPGIFTDSCTGHESDKDHVSVKVYNPEGNFDAECTQLGGGPQGIVKLITKEKDISCTITTATTQEASFQDILLVEMNYMYRQAVTTPLKVMNSQ